MPAPCDDVVSLVVMDALGPPIMPDSQRNRIGTISSIEGPPADERQRPEVQRRQLPWRRPRVTLSGEPARPADVARRHGEGDRVGIVEGGAADERAARGDRGADEGAAGAGPGDRGAGVTRRRFDSRRVPLQACAREYLSPLRAG